MHVLTANAVGVLYHWYGAGQGRPEAAPGAILQISIQHEDGSHELVVTDGSWRVLPGPWLPGKPRNTEGDFVENIDARRIPLGWDRPGFNDASWAPATASVCGYFGSIHIPKVSASRN